MGRTSILAQNKHQPSTLVISCHTDEGADTSPGDPGWCIRREWRVIYYSYRHAAQLPLWDSAADFELLMADVLLRFSSAIPLTNPEGDAIDPRKDRVYQPWKWLIGGG